MNNEILGTSEEDLEGWSFEKILSGWVGIYTKIGKIPSMRVYGKNLVELKLKVREIFQETQKEWIES